MLQWRSGVSGSLWRSRVLSHIPLFPLWEKSQAEKFVLALSCAALGYKWHACQFVFFCPSGILEPLRGLLDFHKGSLSSRGFHIALERLELVHRPLQGSQLGPRSVCQLGGRDSSQFSLHIVSDPTAPTKKLCSWMDVKLLSEEDTSEGHLIWPFCRHHSSLVFLNNQWHS